MLTSEAVSLSMNVATGLVKLANRADRVIAEKAAVEGNLALPMPAVNTGLGAIHREFALPGGIATRQ